ncbi:phospholipase D3-like isoform X2 [Solea senegalensis]|uniref:Phospholipase D3-like isoform X2 n=1 Tax=Solea senegalensis TaxID=28829 RepID=A0AAV6SLB6_SOLSE|nr:5'-3' exonuclease PLD3 isoform X1 [Solea senegalensis]KAG7517894.1 phospholipase D3-like isoform X2 [Solea senegalensis]
MPMILRSKKSIHSSQGSEEEAVDLAAATPRRSIRLYGRTTYEETDESDSASVQNQVMEKSPSPVAEPEEEEEEAVLTELKYCSVLLNRVQAEDTKKELEEKEDMNRKGGKPASRIPTFHKRPSGASQTTELPVPKKDTPVPVSVEASKSKPPDGRETALPLPTIRAPKTASVVPSPFSNAEQCLVTAHSSLITAPKSLGFSSSVQPSLLTASPRPAIRPEQVSEQQLPEQDERKTSEIEADVTPDAHEGHISSHEGSLCQMPQEETTETYEVEVKGRTTLTESGDTETSESGGSDHIAEFSQVDAIMDEEAPWATESTNVPELKDSRSSSDAECEEELIVEEYECLNLEEAKEDQPEPQIAPSEFSKRPGKQADIDESASPVAAQMPTKMRSTKTTKDSSCPSFTFFFLLPTTLLLLGGFGQHVWHYGLPMSVAQLTAHLELHWLEGFGLVPEPCSTDCRVHLVESIPVGLYPSSPPSTQSIADSWLHLLNKANSSVHIAAFYFTLRGSDSQFAESTDTKGQEVFEHLKQLESKGVTLQIAVNGPQTSTQDTLELAATGADVREVNLTAVTGGIVHTKLWVVDQKHLYLGSANMDWRSLSQVKEVGLSVEDCSCLAQDAFRIFGVYWSISGAKNGSLPPYWPARLSALSSSQNPLHLKFNGVPAQVYLSSSPPQISARGRSDDLSTILSVINDAQTLVYISVMDYLPMSQYTEPLRFWPPIDSALRAAACTRGVQVRLLVSCWEHSPASMFIFLQSLLVLNRPPLKCDIEAKSFVVSSTVEQRKIPFARVNHAKYMVTDRVAYIGTSNWSEGYFTHTAGVGMVVNQTGSVLGEGQQTLQSQVEALFLRDWGSQYASALSVDSMNVCPHHRH